MLAHDCFCNFLPVPFMKLFTKYECNYNLRRKLTFLLPKPNTEVLREFTCYKAVSLWNSVDNHTPAITSNSLFKNSLNPIQTGLFWSICDWGGGSSDPPPSVSLEPIMLGSWNLHTMIISIQRSPTPSFDLPRPMMTSQWRQIPIFQCFLLFFHLDT